MRGWGRAIALLALFLSLSVARGQDKDDLGVNVTFGWQGQMPTERWAPITLSITTEKATLSGVLVAEFDQDSTNAARYSTPFAVTPGVMTQAQIIVSLPEYCSRVRLVLEGENGVVLWEKIYGRVSQGVIEPIPALIRPDTDALGVMGRSALVDAQREWPAIMAAVNTAARAGQPPVRKGPGKYESAWSGVAGVRVDEAMLPTSWMGYDGLSALVVIPDSTRPVNARAVEAVYRWVRSGGRLIVQVDQPGDAWREWVPAELGVSLEPGKRGPVPQPVAAALVKVTQTVRSAKESTGEGGHPPGTDVDAPVAGQSVVQRVILPTESAVWTVHMRADATPEAGALVAERQVGFGSVVLVGVDPAKATEMVSTLGAGAAWRCVLEPVLTDVLDRHMNSVQGNYGWGQTTFSSQAAVNAGLERVARVPGLGGSVFVLIIACVVLLGAMVGPVDFFVLRRLAALQKSWATAGLWISIAAVLAFVGPRLVRTEPTRVNRVSVVDCIVPPMVGGESEVAGVGGPAAFSAGLTAVYAGDAGVAMFTKADLSSWWRGVSVHYQNGEFGGGSALVPIAQKAVGGAAGSEKASPLVELPLSLWTFRTFADWSAAAPLVSGRVRATEAGWSVMVSGLPAGVRVVEGVLRVGSKWVTTNRQERVREGDMYNAVSNAPPPGRAGDVRASDFPVEGGVWSGPFLAKYADPMPPRSWAGASEVESVYGGVDRIDSRPGALTSLPAVARRSRAIDRMLTTGKWAAVYLEVADWPVETPVSWDFKGEHTRILRVVLPLEQR